MKKRKMSVLLALLLVFSMAVPSFANSGEMEDPLSEFNARRCVTDYFNDRADYLRSELDDFVTAVPAMVQDEEAHREKLQTDDIMFVESEITIDAVYCDDTRTVVNITETATYVQNGETRQEVIDHEVKVLADVNGDPIVASDRYREEYSDFDSCSYVPPEAGLIEPQASGSRYCIVNVAYGEVGYTETGDNITKYGAWYGEQVDWCAIFVSWCANQANVSTSIIKEEKDAGFMRNNFANMGQFYLSKSQGGLFTPRSGDLFFHGTNSTSVSHVGFVNYVSGNTVYVIDGNWSNKVSTHSYSLSSSDLVGFARPQYASTGHTYKTENGVYVCSACGHRTTHIDEINGGEVVEELN